MKKWFRKSFTERIAAFFGLEVKVVENIRDYLGWMRIAKFIWGLAKYLILIASSGIF